jgi:glycosyltransferase involved in cell wall biosynthesis
MPRKLKIGFASTDWSRTYGGPDGPIPGGANYVRLQQVRPHLRHASVTGLLLHHPLKGVGVLDWFERPHYDCDIIVMQRLMFKDLVNKLEDKQGGPPIVNDLDDWYWGLHEDNHAYKLTHPDHNDDENIDNYRRVLEMSDVVTVSTPFLENKMVDEFAIKNVVRIENCVNTDIFRKRHPRPKKTIVGWVGSTSHRSGDLETVAPFINNQKWRLHHSGHVDGAAWFADKIGVDRGKVTKTPMYPPSQYAALSFQFDIGIAPLNDIPFNHAKSWIKAIEYAAANVPFVASDLGEYRRLHDQYGIGRLASTPQEWVDHIMELCDTGLRSREARAQREIVVENLDVRNMASAWSDLFDQLA